MSRYLSSPEKLKKKSQVLGDIRLLFTLDHKPNFTFVQNWTVIWARNLPPLLPSL